MINKDGLDVLSQSVAQEVYRETGIRCGHIARMDTIGQRAIFAFKLLANYSHQAVSYDDLSRAHSWQGIYEGMVRQTLADTAPWALAKKLAMQIAGETPPEIPIVIDQKGRRHHRLVAETGYIFGKENGSGTDN